MTDYMNLIEEISFNAWPARKTELYDGWLLRYSHFYTHRTHCVNLLAPSHIDLEEKISYCEGAYHKVHTPTIFKINPSLCPDFDQLLESKGYHIEHKVDVMCMTLDHFEPYQDTLKSQDDINVELTDTITDDWIMSLFQLNGTTNPTHLRIVPDMFKAIPKDTIVARIIKDNRMVASGLGILDRSHIGLYAIYVDKHYRNYKLGSRICSAIIQKGISMGMTHSYLQVVHDNTIAKQLYKSLGYEFLYSYWFRVL